MHKNESVENVDYRGAAAPKNLELHAAAVNLRFIARPLSLARKTFCSNNGRQKKIAEAAAKKGRGAGGEPHDFVRR